MSSSFFGPTAPWERDLDEVSTYDYVQQRAKETLAAKLRERLIAVEGGVLDDLLLEIRKQICEAALEGHTTVAGDLNDLTLELLSTREHVRRLV